MLRVYVCTHVSKECAIDQERREEKGRGTKGRIFFSSILSSLLLLLFPVKGEGGGGKERERKAQMKLAVM